METVESRLAAKGMVLPLAVDTQFSYRPIIVDGAYAYIAGQLAKQPGDILTSPGVVGQDVTLDQACAVARDCALQALAWIKKETGTLETVRRVLRLNGYVHVGPGGFDYMSKIIDSASETLMAAFGPSGEHVRSVLGMADLPRHASVMIDLTVALHER